MGEATKLGEKPAPRSRSRPVTLINPDLSNHLAFSLRHFAQRLACQRRPLLTALVLRYGEHGAGRGNAPQSVGSEGHERRASFGGEGAGDEDGAVKRTA